MSLPSPFPSDSVLILQAVRLAAFAHYGQMRKYTQEPYLTHCLNVAQGVASATADPHVICAALLHDTLEDTNLSVEHIQATVSERTATLVVALTDYYTATAFPDLNRRARKDLEAERLGRTSADTQLIKAYDMLDNMLTIYAFDPKFALVYREEKRHLLTKLTKLDPHERALLNTACELPLDP